MDEKTARQLALSRLDATSGERIPLVCPIPSTLAVQDPEARRAFQAIREALTNLCIPKAVTQKAIEQATQALQRAPENPAQAGSAPTITAGGEFSVVTNVFWDDGTGQPVPGIYQTKRSLYLHAANGRVELRARTEETSLVLETAPCDQPA